jgi:hypothetical protein
MSTFEDRIKLSRPRLPDAAPEQPDSSAEDAAPAFTNRYEVKYLVAPERLPEIHASLGKFLRRDVNGVHDGGYYVHSIYFDSPDYRFYREKTEGELVRLKPRLRLYRTSLDGPPTGIFLELKGRYDRIVHKRRVSIDRPLAERLLHQTPIHPNGWAAESPVLSEFQYLSHRFQLRPCVSVLYHRTAFFGAYWPDVRMTFDRLVLCSPATGLNAASEGFVQTIPCSQTVVELKYNDKLPRFMLNQLHSLGLQQRSFSKYATSLERCFRGLDGGRTIH